MSKSSKIWKCLEGYFCKKYVKFNTVWLLTIKLVYNNNNKISVNNKKKCFNHLSFFMSFVSVLLSSTFYINC